MKGLRFYLALIFFGTCFSCHKKEYPPSVEIVNPAIYYSRLTIDNKPLVLEAGVDGYYMYSSYKLDSNFVNAFVADLKKPACSNCSSLKIQINDYKTTLSGGISDIDSALRADHYPLLSGRPEAAYAVQFAPLTPASSYTWNFGDGTDSHDPSPVKQFDRSGSYKVCLTTQSDMGCFSSICNKEKIDVSDKSCKASIEVINSSGNSLGFNAKVSGQGPFQYLWNFGDGTTSNQSSFVCNYRYRGAYAVSLRVVDAFGDTAYAQYNAKTATDLSSCTANYTVTGITKLQTDLAFSHVTITWADENGTVYTSNNAQQPSNSSFEILSVSEDGRNENAQLTKKITAKFKCRLYNGTKSITVNDAEVVICVAYK